MKNSLQKYPFFLFLLPSFLVLHILKEFYSLIEFKVVSREILSLYILPISTLAVFQILTRSFRKSSLITLLIMLPFYFLGELKDWFLLAKNQSFFGSYSFLIPATLLLMLICMVIILKSHSNFNRIFLYVNTLLIAICLIDLVSLLFFGDKNRKFEIAESYQTCSNCEKPDIYFLVFDSYSSTALLKDELGYDNSSLDSALMQKGFKIIPQSRSNYNLTPFSIGSSFNMEYLQGADTSRLYRLRNYLPAVKKIYDNALIQILEKEGYEIYNHSLFDIRNHPSSIPGFDIWGTKQLFEQHILFKKLDKDIGWQFPSWMRLGPENKLKVYSQNRDRHDSIAIRNILGSAAASTQKPKFVYGHLFLPHSPYTYDSSGNKIEPIGVMQPDADKKAYVQQVVYTRKIMLQLIDSILSNHKRPLALIIQGDHGYRFFDKSKDEKEFPNLNAVYFSNGNYHGLNDSMTNVQTFRFLLNNWFGKQYPYPDNHFYFLHYK